MKTLFKQRAALVVSLFFIITVLIPANVWGASNSNDSQLIIKINSGSKIFSVNGKSLTAEKSYISGKTIYIPLRAVLESMGAEVNWLGSGKVNVLYREVSVDLKIGNSNIHVNQTEKKLSAPPVIKNKSVMIPADFVEKCFDAKVSSNLKKGEITITLNNDGALSDLSFLIGSISKTKAGNSYFGWKINVPKGSRILSQSFNSKKVQFENESRNIQLDIFVDINSGKTLEEYYEELVENSSDILGGELIDSALNTESNPAYIELLYINEYDEAIYHRIFEKGKYFYNVAITSFSESNPNTLKNDKYMAEIMNSFKLEYSNDKGDTTDLSKVKFGLAQYYNYISSDTGKKYITWDMCIIPEWDIIQPQNTNPYITQFGTSLKEYISVDISAANGISDIAAYGEKVESDYESNFNPTLYTLLKSDKSSVGQYQAYNMVYDVKMGNKKYRYDERFIILGGLVYDITLKSPLESYANNSEKFQKMLETFKPSQKYVNELMTGMEKYQFNLAKNQLGKDESPVSYENKSYGWNIKFPGYWQKDNTEGKSVETFYNPKTGALIMIEAIEKKGSNENKTDEEKYQIMNYATDMELEPVKTNTINTKNKTVKYYEYRIEEEEGDTFANMYYYVIEGDKYSYCFMSTIPDLTANTQNLKDLEDAWNSFTLVEQTSDK